MFFLKMLLWGLGAVGVLSILIASITSAMKTKSEDGTSSFLMMVFMIVVVCPLYIYIMPEDSDASKPKVYAAAKVEVDPLLEARRERAREIDRENRRMEEYADSEHKKLSAKSTKVAVNPSSVNGMAEYRYYLKSGKIVSCLRGFDGEVLAFNCTKYSFD
ncbi:hypothetical protein CD175_30175 [Pseudomonas laurylsulfatiphila]|uniref:Uncharacterized protein n=1 Tax=Pseudomonas laurylsulfatiphila TaxID=2011015 RepID=A0A2S6FCQ0_9PSED|nr:hypothetical protein [Pseudomonas laurylsulfatiphila]PPK35162.1 hypothetical protein CD175_30175 [Pseudomonas laurylsulfatiphila]